MESSSRSVLLVGAQTIRAGSATWSLNPVSSDWNTAANWSPATVPNGPADPATFDVSNTTGVSLSATTEVSEIVFNPGASAYTIRAPKKQQTGLTISGRGVINRSGVGQSFVAPFFGTDFPGPTIVFRRNARRRPHHFYRD